VPEVERCDQPPFDRFDVWWIVREHCASHRKESTPDRRGASHIGRAQRSYIPSNRLTPTTAGAAYSTLPCAKMACYSSGVLRRGK
jgi:hypothetical protein